MKQKKAERNRNPQKNKKKRKIMGQSWWTVIDLDSSQLDLELIEHHVNVLSWTKG